MCLFSEALESLISFMHSSLLEVSSVRVKAVWLGIGGYAKAWEL